MLETSARLLRLLSLLQTPRDWTGAELAERLAVSARTIRNDVERLRTLGYPVHGSRGSVGGYRLGAGAALPPLLLDDEEAVAVAIGLRTAAGGTITGVEETSLRALAKLEKVLPARLRRRVEAIQRYAVAVPWDDLGPRVDADVLSTLTSACRDHDRVRFDYQSHDGSASQRDVEPYQLVNWGRRWYLVAFDIERADWRTFRVDRISLRTPGGPRFTPRDLPEEAVDQVRRGVSSATWRYRARVVVRTSAEKLAERINPAIGTITPIGDNSCLLETGSDNVELLAVHLGLLGVDFTATEPPELVEALRVLGERYRRAVP
ncbi:YafY family protein [Amycolatopsis sp. NPDC004079]|uniref:helix-turn-helix transcriptional regulator n=1 Tax=Amycolatopsis sp. NPDC004079 TaxID=3154549 RepID=UPI0033AD2478